MDKTVKKICTMLKQPDHLRQCGAALVLAELAPKDKQVVKLLGETLEGAGSTLTECVLTAMEAIGSREAAAYAMPLLNVEQPAVQLRAAAIISAGGAGIVPEIKERLAQARRSQKRILFDILARIHSLDAFEVLLDQLFNPDFELVREACGAVQRHVRAAAAADRLRLHKRIVQFMNSPRVKDKDRVFTSCLLLLGYTGRGEAGIILLKYATPKTPAYFRRHALIALKGLDYTAASRTKVLNRVFPFLDEDDPDIVRNVLDVIDRLADSKSLEKSSAGISSAQWKKLLKNRHDSVRRYATRKLAADDTASNNQLLLDLLHDESTDVREIAASALAAHSKAGTILLEALLAEKDLDAAWLLAKILKPHGNTIRKPELKKISSLACKEMLAGQTRWEPLLYFLKNADAGVANSALLDAGLKHKSAKRWDQAVECLRRLIHTEAFTDDVSYALSVCDLKRSAKDLAPNLRAQCHALRGFQSLLRRNRSNLMKRLVKDKSLDASDLYYVGFHFREGMGDDKTFGEELLRHVAKKWPKSWEGKSVKKSSKPVRSRKPAGGKPSKKTAEKMSRKTVQKKAKK